MNRNALALVLGVLVLAVVVTGAIAFDPPLEERHQHDAHSGTLSDVAYDSEHNVVWSLDENGTFVGYDVKNSSVMVTDEVGTGHALAVGDGVVYIADDNTLWEYDVAADDRTELTTMRSHAGALAYDERRDVVWMTGGQRVAGYHAGNGSLFLNHTEHTDGTSALAVSGDYVASGTTFSDEVLVYNVTSERVTYRPDLADDVRSVGALEFTDDERLLVGSDAENDSFVAMYDVADRRLTDSYREHIFGPSGVEFIEDESVIVSTGVDNVVVFYDVGTDSVVARHRHDDTIYAADLDTQNGLLWFGDGESGPGSVIGLDVTEAPTPTATPTASPTPAPGGTATPTAAGTPTPTDPATAAPEDGATATPDDGSSTKTPANDGDGGGGGTVLLVGAIGALIVLGAGGYLYLQRSE